MPIADSQILHKQNVVPTHERWASEQHDRDLKPAAALDHYGRRLYPGLHRHVALAALLYTIFESDRQRSTEASMLSIGAIRAAVRRSIFMLFALGERYAGRAAARIRDLPEL